MYEIQIFSNCKFPVNEKSYELTKNRSQLIIPSLTVGREKNGYKSSKYGRCSRFLSCIDMCYISVFFTTFVFLIIVRIEVFVVIS